MTACDYLVVGAGLFGSVLAERLANGLGKDVLVIDKRPHIGGNCYSEVDPETGIEFHSYGTHIFHTPDREVWGYVCRFTEFNGYRHQVLTTHRGKVYQMPINLETINALYGLSLKPAEARALIDKEIAGSGIDQPSNLEEKAISLVGRPLYEALIKGYTAKQWRRPVRELPADIITRLPVRFDYNENYYADLWQGIPLDGYTKIFERMLDSPKIRVELNTDYFTVRDSVQVREKTIYTGSADRYFDYRHGKLEWRGCDFRREVVPVEDYQGTSVMNYADAEIPWTRIHEPRHLHPERPYQRGKTVIFREYPRDDSGDMPLYPINDARNLALHDRYRALMGEEKGVVFGGRLAEYRYLDMHHVIGRALEIFRRIKDGKL